MNLLKHRQAARGAHAEGPYWPLELPRWSALLPASAREVRPAPQTTWTCARCGAVAGDIRAAREHINLHSLQDLPLSAHPAPRGGRRRLMAVRGHSRRAG